MAVNIPLMGIYEGRPMDVRPRSSLYSWPSHRVAYGLLETKLYAKLNVARAAGSDYWVGVCDVRRGA